MTARGKGKEISLQVEIESQEDWEENLAKEGLLVIDVYQEWCGPCKAMVPIFKRIKNESGDDLLRFAIAKADTVEALDRYRGKCEPKFLFYAGGLLVEVIHGADSPVLARSILQQLENEKKVAEGSANRKETIDAKFPTSKRRSVKETVVSALEEYESSIESSDEEAMEERRTDSHMKFGGENIVLSDIDGEAKDGVFIEKECGIIVIYPDVLADGKIRDIVTKLKTSKFDILDEVEKECSESDIKEIFGSTPEYTKDFQTFMTSGPVYALLVTKGEFGERIFTLIQEAIGASGVSIGIKDASPNSLRGNFLMSDSKFSGFYSSESSADAKRDIALFFPNYVSKKVSLTNMHSRVEMITVLVIRPAILERLNAIMDTLTTLEFKVVKRLEKEFTEEEIDRYYKHDYSDDESYNELLESMLNRKCLILVLTNGKDSVVDDLLSQIGPKEPALAFMQAPNSFRGRFGIRDSLVSNFEASTTIDDAEKEFFRYFPTQQALVIVKPDAYGRRDEIMTLLRKKDFFVSGRKEVQLTKEQAEDIYKEKIEEEFYEDLIESMICGPICAMILSKYNAIEELNSLIRVSSKELFQPADREILRNQFGTDALKNGLRVSHTKEDAIAEIKMFWGDVAFEDDGTMKKKKKVKRETVCEAKGKLTTKEENLQKETSENQENDENFQEEDLDLKTESRVGSRSESKQESRAQSKISQNNPDTKSRQSNDQDSSRPPSKVSVKSSATSKGRQTSAKELDINNKPNDEENLVNNAPKKKKVPTATLR